MSWFIAILFTNLYKDNRSTRMHTHTQTNLRVEHGSSRVEPANCVESKYFPTFYSQNSLFIQCFPQNLALCLNHSNIGLSVNKMEEEWADERKRLEWRGRECKEWSEWAYIRAHFGWVKRWYLYTSIVWWCGIHDLINRLDMCHKQITWKKESLIRWFQLTYCLHNLWQRNE